MDDAMEFIGASWFIAGFLAAHPDAEGIPETELIDAAREQAFEAIDQYQRGGCIGCGREGVVLLDGSFCERCAPGVVEYIEGVRDA